MMSARVLGQGRSLVRAFSAFPAMAVESQTQASLPWYPPPMAAERKQVINSVVVGTGVGETPRIPPRGYLEEEHRMWSAVYKRVINLASEHACLEYLEAVTKGAGYDMNTIPDVKLLSERLQRMTGWRIAPVTGSIPATEFFAHLEVGHMPCTMYIRPHSKFAFTEDPDCVHEMLGHIPALFIPSWSRCYKAFGETARRLSDQGKDKEMEQLILMYFAVVEKGLVREGGPDGTVKAIGASVISGSSELVYAMEHPETHLPLDIDLVMKYGSTDEDGFMEHFFVGESVDDMAQLVMEWMQTL